MIKIAALHRVGEDAAQTAVDTLDRRFGERLSVRLVLLFAQLCVETAEVFGTQLDELIAAKVWLEPFDVLLLAHERGLRQFVRRNRLEPDFRVLFQRDRPVNVRVQLFTAHLEQHRLLLQPLLRLLRCKICRRLDRFLLRIAPPSIGCVAHRDDEQVAIPAFSDTCHFVIPPVSLSTAEIL